MARPRKSEASKLGLMDIGTELLTRHGYHGTGIKQLLDSAGIPKGSFYNLFDSKEAFVASIIQRYGELILDEMNTAISGLHDKPALVRLWCSFHNKVINRVNQQQSCACLLGAMAAEIAESSPMCREAIAAVEQQWQSTLGELVKQAMAQGDINTHLSAEDLTQLIYNCWQGSLLHYLIDDDDQSLLRHQWNLLHCISSEQGRKHLQPYPISPAAHTK